MTNTSPSRKSGTQLKSWGIKTPGEDGITGEIYKSVFEIFPIYITAIYNGCLKRGIFPLRWKRARLIRITKPGKENNENVFNIAQ